MMTNSLAKINDSVFGCVTIFYQLHTLFSLECDRKMAVRIRNWKIITWKKTVVFLNDVFEILRKRMKKFVWRKLQPVRA